MKPQDFTRLTPDKDEKGKKIVGADTKKKELSILWFKLQNQAEEGRE